LNIGILSQWFDPEPGSAAVPGVLARALRDRGHRVQVVTGFPNYPTGKLADGYQLRRRLDEDSSGITVRRVALYPSHDRSALRRSANYGSFALSAVVNGLKPLRQADAIWVYNSPPTVGLPSWLATAGGGPPHLMHVLDLWPESLSFAGLLGSRSNRRVERALDWWCRFTYRQAGAIACISQGVLDALSERGVPPSKLHHVPVWTDENRYMPRPRDQRLADQLGVGQTFVLLYAGNLGDAQGLDDLLDACARLGDLPDFHCLIAGSGTAEDRLRRRAAELCLTNTTFLGRWPAEDMGALLSVGDVHLVSLKDHALSDLTLPSKLPTILASGRPVLASARGEVARVITDSGAGWVARPESSDDLEAALRAAYADRDRLGSFGAAARTYYDRHFSLERGVQRVEELLSELAGSGASAWAS
jgi:colanic acid biosynthesis glycosyl transferase WcaI